MPHTLKDVLPSSARLRSNGHLEIGGADTVDLAREFGTPLFVMCEDTFRERALRYREAYTDADVYYAGKAFLCVAMAKMVAEEGLGLDVASGGELFTALKASFPPERIIFHGNNKSDAELEMGMKAGVGRIVADSMEELERADAIAGSLGARTQMMLRVTPGVEAHTHEYIQTGQEDSKFGMSVEGGVALEAAKRARDLPNLDVVGFHSHIGSNITGVEAFLRTVEILAEFCASVRDATGIQPAELNLGGGLAIAYTRGDFPARVESFATEVRAKLQGEMERLGLPVPRIGVEPARWLIANAMVTLYTVGTVKEIPGIRTYVSVDGGMSDNIRPALYGARYEALLANKADVPSDRVVTIAGAHCEQGDLLIKDVSLPASVGRGDVLAVPATGAYGYSMASNYNRFPRPAVIVVEDGDARVIVARETYEDVTSRDL
ncbi:MAG: diaminopimelate decarboxylase [Actinobacteria bacterium]|nr:MAG: diaminopimelate decarboxylase [Actinomycetota bacterium]